MPHFIMKHKRLLSFALILLLFSGQEVLSAEPVFGMYTALPDSFHRGSSLFQKVTDDSVFWYGILVKDEDTLKIFDQGFDRRMTRTALIPSPIEGDSLLLVEQYSGGAHCCWTYWLLDFSGDSLREVFYSGDYPVGYQVSLNDLNSDGRYEWVQSLLTFDYFLVLSHAMAPIIPVIFKFEAGTFVPANPEFSSLLLKDIHSSIQFLNNSLPIHEPIRGDSPQIETFSHLMRVMLTLCYSGQNEEASRLFKKYYQAKDASTIMLQINMKLQECRVFREIRSRYPE